MAKTIGRLNPAQVDSGELERGLFADGANLYLRVAKDRTNRSWAFIYRSPSTGRQREAGLGRAIGKAGAGKVGVSLAEARSEAKRGRELLNSKPPIDPLTVWRATPETGVPTFAEAVEEYVALNKARWRSAVHTKQWRDTIVAWLRAGDEGPGCSGSMGHWCSRRC